MPFHCDSKTFEIAPTKKPSAMAYTGPRNLARWGLKYSAITAMKPTITPIMATTGNVTFVEPSGLVVDRRGADPADGGAGQQQHEQHGRRGDRAPDRHHAAPRADRAVGDGGGGRGGRRRAAPMSCRQGSAPVARPSRTAPPRTSCRSGSGWAPVVSLRVDARRRAPVVRRYPPGPEPVDSPRAVLTML